MQSSLCLPQCSVEQFRTRPLLTPMHTQSFSIDARHALFSGNTIFIQGKRALDRTANWLALKGIDIFERGLCEYMPKHIVHTLKSLAERDPSINTLLTLGLCENMLAWYTVRNQYNECITLQSLLLGKGGPRFTVGEVVFVQALLGTHLGLYTVLDNTRGRLLLRQDFIGDDPEPILASSGYMAALFPQGAHVGVRLLRVNGDLCVGNALYPLSHTGYTLLKERVEELFQEDEYTESERAFAVDACLLASVALWAPCLEKITNTH